MKNISILGSTGSIGTQTLDIVRANDDLNVVAIAAGSNITKLEEQIREFHPELVCVFNEDAALKLKDAVKDTSVKLVAGMDGLIEAAVYEKAEIVVTAFVGMIGIRPTLEAIKAGKDIALANKETLVTAGHIVMSMAKEYGVKILPVDSEHSAIFQCLNGENSREIDKILLTASGGPFRGRTREQMKNVQVVVQPQSLIHSMVQFKDGAIMAQLGTPDMRLPIQYALYYPERRFLAGERVDFGKIAQITFENPDPENFRGLALAYQAATVGGSMPTVFNAANEKAVAKFLNRKIGFLDITDIIEYCMSMHKAIPNPTVEQILDIEQWTYELIESRW